MTRKRCQHISHTLYNKNKFFFLLVYVLVFLNVRMSLGSKEQKLFCYLPMLFSFPVSPAYCTSHMPFSFRSPSNVTTGLHTQQNSSCNFSPTISRLPLITSFWSRAPSAVENRLAAIAPWDPTCASSWYCSLMWRWTSNKRRRRVNSWAQQLLQPVTTDYMQASVGDWMSILRTTDAQNESHPFNPWRRQLWGMAYSSM